MRLKAKALYAAFLGTGLAATALRAQELPPAPVPAQARELAPAPKPATIPGPPMPQYQPVPPAPLFAPPVSSSLFEDNNGPLLRGDALLSPPDVRRGLFIDVEAGIVIPHIKNHLSSDVAIIPYFTDTVFVEFAPLSWTASPKIELGYRFDRGFGEFRVAYQSLISEGTARILDYDYYGDGELKSRLNVNMLDLDYAIDKFAVSCRPSWQTEAQFRLGARLASVYMDTRAQGQILGQRVSNNFLGAGPHSGVDLFQALPWQDLGLFARVQGAVAVGQTRQAFEETFISPGYFSVGGATSVRATQTVPILDVQAGLTWTPNGSKYNFAFTAGYQFQEWWYLGQTDTSNASLTAQGFFIRGEWGF
jgi:hypothetical protein